MLPLLVATPTAASECVILDFNAREAVRYSDVAFSGVVTAIDDINDRLNFRVDRVWKGPVGRDIWIWQLDAPSVDSYVFRPQQDVKYIIFARALSADDRKFRVKPNEPTAYGIHRPCGAGPMWSMDKVRELEKITPGKKPRP